MFGGRKRQDALLVQAIHEELASADRYARGLLADAIAQMETRLSTELEQRARLHQTCTEIAIESVHQSVTGGATDIASALEKVADMYAIVTERLEADRLERRALTEAILRLAPSAALAAPARTIGGTVFTSADDSAHNEISLVAAENDDDHHDAHDDADHDFELVRDLDDTAPQLPISPDNWCDENPWKRPPSSSPSHVS